MHFSNKTGFPLTPHPWFLWRDGAHDPAFNMAADHVLFDHVAVFGKPLLRLYTWDRLTVSFGRSQRYPRAIPHGFSAIRRPTGGGVVEHGADCTYTLVLPAEHPLSMLEICESYQFIHLALLSQFSACARLSDQKADADPLTMRCFDSPVRFDILGLNGEKCAGAAQLRRGGASLTQGSIRLSVTGGGHEAMQESILRAFEETAHAQLVAWEPDEFFLAEVRERVSLQYATDGWNENGTLPLIGKKDGQ